MKIIQASDSISASAIPVRRPQKGAGSIPVIFTVLMGWVLAACSGQKDKAPDPDRDTASLEMLSDADRAKLAQIAEYSPEAIGRAKELVASPEVFVRMMTLTRLERWPRDRMLTFALGAAGHDPSSLVRAKGLALAWRGVTQLDHDDERFQELVDATLARLTDPDEGLFDLAVKHLLTVEDTGHLAKLRQVIPQAAPERIGRLFQLFCRKDLSREDANFIIEHDRQLGAAGAACRAQVSRAQRMKYLYE